MEDQERKWIKENLPDLIKNTNCNVLLLSYLQSKDVISVSDVEDISKRAGDLAKAERLYQILPNRTRSFSILLEALEHVRQTGSLKILQKFAGPKWVLDPQRMFLSVGDNVLSFLETKKQNTLILTGYNTKIITDKILQNVPKSVLLDISDVVGDRFELRPWIKVVVTQLNEQWSQVLKTFSKHKDIKLILVACNYNKSLETFLSKNKGMIDHHKDNTNWADLNPSFQLEIANRLNKKCFGLDVSNILVQFQEPILSQLINATESVLFPSGLQKVTPYYVERTILYKNAISLSIFEYPASDIWIFKNMKRNELASLAKRFEIDCTSNQIHQTAVTTQFLILDFISDFDRICSQTKSTVHLIEKVENNLFWKQTRGSLQNILECIDEKIVGEFSEAALIESVAKIKTVKENTIIISDTPGMGKSFLLENLGRRLQELYPNRMVIFVVWSELVDKLSVYSTLCIEDILLALAKLICQSEVSQAIFQHLVSQIHMELLLDGFDETKPEKIHVALNVLSILNDCMPRIRKWVTTRPHYQKQLEERCSTIAYHITAFNEQNQIQFLNAFWLHAFAANYGNQPNGPENEIEALNNNLLKKFAKKCLHDIKTCLNQNSTDLVGTPLQCMLIAESFQEDAYRYSKFDNCSNLNALEFSLPIASISDLYRLFVSTKIKYYLVRTQNSKVDMQTLEHVHFYHSLLLLFPNYATKFNLQVNLNSANASDYLAIGILHADYLGDSPRFVHRTFAEYFVSEFCIKQMQNQVISDCFLEFLFKTVMNTEHASVFVPCVYEFKTACFQQKTVCHFLNSSIQIVIKSDTLSNLEEKLDRVYRTPIIVQDIAHASAVENYANIFNFLAATNAFHWHQNHLVLDRYFLHIIVFKCALGFIKAVLKIYDSLQQKRRYQFDDANSCNTPYAISENLKKTVEKSWIVFDSSESGRKSVLHTAVIRGDSSIFLFLVQHTGFINTLKDCPVDLRNLVHFLVESSMRDSNDQIESRSVIMKTLLDINPEFLHFKLGGLSAFLRYQVHVRLQEELLLAGADPLSRDTSNNTLWHVVATRSSCSDFYRLLTCVTCHATRSKIVNAKDINGNTVLQVLVASCNLEEKTIHLLSKCGADFNTRNLQGDTPIFTAVSAFRDSKIILLLQHYGADIMAKNKSGLSIIHHAAVLGNVYALETLTTLCGNKYGIKNVFSLKDDNGKTPMQYAQLEAPGDYVHGKQLCVEFLLKKCSVISPSEIELSSEGKLVTAASSSSDAEILVNKGWEFFRVNAVKNGGVKESFRLILVQPKQQSYFTFNFKCKDTYITVYPNSCEKFKVERKTDIRGLTRLLESIIVLSNFLKFELGSLEILLSNASSAAVGDLVVLWLLDQQLTDNLIVVHLEWCVLKGVDINSWSLNGSPLLNEIIKISASVKPLIFLLDQGAQIDRSDSVQNTALHVLFQCSRCTDYEATSLLIKKGADVQSCNANGDTPLMLLCKNRKKVDIRTYFLLQSAGAIFNSEIASLTMHWLADCFNKNDEIISAFKYLVSKGADVLWKRENEDRSAIEIVWEKYGKNLTESVLQSMRQKEFNEVTAQVDCPEALRATKLSFGRFAYEFELTSTKLIDLKTYAINTKIDISEYQNKYRLSLTHIGSILEEVYSDDMTDIAIIFAFVLSIDYIHGLHFLCDWCKKRDGSFTISHLKFNTKKGVQWLLLSYTVSKGSFECLKHLVENEGFRDLLFETLYQDLLHDCLHLEKCDNIINYLCKINPNLLNGKRNNKTLLEAENLYPKAFFELCTAGAKIDDFIISEVNICNCHAGGNTIPHYLAAFADSTRFHKFVEEIHSKQLLPTLFSKQEKLTGATPLHNAIYEIELQYETVKLLVDSGVDINIQSNSGHTPLMTAVYKQCSMKFIQTMISLGADMSKISFKDDPSQRTILHYMTQHYFEKAATFNTFLKFCNDQNLMCHFKVSDKFGNTALHYAFQFQHITGDMLPLIFPDSSFITLCNNNNQTILHFAAAYLDLSTYETLLEMLKCKHMLSAYNQPDVLGNTPLHWLAKSRNKSECISKLLVGEQEINFNITNIRSETFLHSLVTNNVSIATFATLFASGVDVNIHTTDGKTFVHSFINNHTSQDIHNLFVLLAECEMTELLVKETNDNESLTSLEYGIVQKKISFNTLEFIKSIGVNLDRVNSKTKRTLLHLAAKINDLQTIKFLLNLDLNAREQDETGNTFLHLLAGFGTAISFHEITKFIIKLKMTVIFNTTNVLYHTPLHVALRARTLTPAILNLIQPYFADFNARDIHGMSMLHNAITPPKHDMDLFDISLVQHLLEIGVDPYLVDMFGNTFLHYAAAISILKTDFFAFIKFVSSKCDAAKLFGIRNSINGATPLHVVVTNLGISLKTFEFLKSKGIKFNVVDNSGVSILMSAVKAKYPINTLKHLIENTYCNVYLEDNKGKTIAHYISTYLSEYEFHEIASCLLSCKHGVLFGLSDDLNRTPLHEAVTRIEILPSTLDMLCGKTPITSSGNVSTKESSLLNNRYVDLNAVDLKGDSILKYAVCFGRSLKFIKQLIELGAKWEMKNNHNSNLSHTAASFGNLELLEYFVKRGCDINELDNDGDNALQCVVHDSSKNVYEIVEFLLRNGVDKGNVNKEGKTAYDYAIQKSVTDKRILNLLS